MPHRVWIRHSTAPWQRTGKFPRWNLLHSSLTKQPAPVRLCGDVRATRWRGYGLSSKLRECAIHNWLIVPLSTNEMSHCSCCMWKEYSSERARTQSNDTFVEDRCLPIESKLCFVESRLKARTEQIIPKTRTPAAHYFRAKIRARFAEKRRQFEPKIIMLKEASWAHSPLLGESLTSSIVQYFEPRIMPATISAATRSLASCWSASFSRISA